MEYLLARGSASVNFRSTFPSAYRRGWTALAYAAERGERELVMVLLNSGADVLLKLAGPGAGRPQFPSLWALATRILRGCWLKSNAKK